MKKYQTVIINDEIWVQNGPYKRKIVGYDQKHDAFIRENDCKLNAQLTDKELILNHLEKY